MYLNRGWLKFSLICKWSTTYLLRMLLISDTKGESPRCLVVQIKLKMLEGAKKKYFPTSKCSLPMELVALGCPTKRLIFPNSVNSDERRKLIFPLGESCQGCDFKDFLSLLFAIQFNCFLGPEICLLGFPVPKEFWNTELVIKINVSLFRGRGEGQLCGASNDGVAEERD